MSPTQFNIYVADFPKIASERTSFADDITVFASGVNKDDLTSQLTEDLKLVQQWAADVKLDISPSKSSITLFTPSTHEFHHHPQVTMDGVVVPLQKNPKILGVTLDPLYTFSPHVKEVVKSAQQRLKIMKALAGTSWGQDRDTLLLTYKDTFKNRLCGPGVVP